MFRFLSMRVCSGWRMMAFLWLGLLVGGTRVEAQGIGLLVTASPSTVGVNNLLTYTITVTNLAGFEYIYITNTLPASTRYLTASNANGYISAQGNTVVFSFSGQLGYGSVVQVTVTARPTVAEIIVNSTVVATGDLLFSASTNVPTLVTNAVVPVGTADLAVAMTGPSAQVFSNDWMSYGVSVTNLGPDSAPGVFLTNALPAGVGYKSASSSNQSFAVSVQNSNVIFSLGTLTNQAFMNFQLTVQPTNAGVLPFVSTVSTNGVFDPNPGNNSAGITVSVSNFLSNPGQLTATIVSTQKFNPLSARLEQSIVLSNGGPNAVDAARVIVTGLAPRLFNAVGTNNGSPFVTCAAPLTNGQSVYLLLQFYPNQSPFAFSNAQLHAVGVTLPNLAPAATGLTPTNIAVLVRLPSGGMLITFPSLTNRTYTVAYSSDLLSTNWLAAQPLTTTPANYTYWIDYGPPETVSHPTNTPARFYRVFLNP